MMRSSAKTRFVKVCDAALHTAVVVLLSSGLLWVLPRALGLAAGLVLSVLQTPPH